MDFVRTTQRNVLLGYVDLLVAGDTDLISAPLTLQSFVGRHARPSLVHRFPHLLLKLQVSLALFQVLRHLSFERVLRGHDAVKTLRAGLLDVCCGCLLLGHDLDLFLLCLVVGGRHAGINQLFRLIH